MKKLVVLLAALAIVGAAGAGNYHALGYSEDTIIHSEMGDECVGVPAYNHDMSFENGYAWRYGGIAPPYYGAWAEGFDLGPINVECGLYWFSQTGYYAGRPMDAYVWEGGVTGPPGGVLCLVPGIVGLNIGFWPTCTLNEVEINCCVAGEFSVGFWADFADFNQWYVCVDENGFGGYPWTNFAPDSGYTPGWADPAIVGTFANCVSLGIGATLTDHPSAPESRTWGAIKDLFGK